MSPRDDNDRLRDGDLPEDAFAGAVPLEAPPPAPPGKPWRPFPVEVLPEPCRSLVIEATAALGCDSCYVAIPMLVALAGCIGNVRRILLKASWVEPAVVWSAVVGRSGTIKSPAQQIVFSPLHADEIVAIERHRDDVSNYDRDLEVWKAAPRGGRGEMPQRPPPPQRLIMSETTIEAVAARLEENPRGLIVARDELAAWLAGFDMYRGGRGGDAQKWIEMHGARPLIVDRKSGNQRTLCVANAAVSLTGGIQPEILKELLGKEHFHNGLASRLLMAMPPAGPKKWTEAVVGAGTAERLADVYRRLRALPGGMDANQRFSPIDIPLSPEARPLWIEFYGRHAVRQAEAGTDALAASFAKIEGYAARFALLFHCVSHLAELGERVGEVGAASMLAGIQAAEWFADEQDRVYALLCESSEVAQRRELIGIVRRMEGRVTVRELMQASRRYRDRAEIAEAALDALVEAKLGRWERREPGPRGGQPTREFVLADGRPGEES